MSSSTSYSITLLCLVFFLVFSSFSLASTVTYDHRSLIIDGQRKLLLSASIHYPRSVPAMWPGLIKTAKEGGNNVIDTYVFWNGHELSPGNYYFDKRYGLVKFAKIVQQEGMYLILRIGPYICAEWNFGLYAKLYYIYSGPDEEIEAFCITGRPYHLSQVENEYGGLERNYGAGGKSYAMWAAKMAISQNIGVPWIMCWQYDAPDPLIDTCNSFYCDQFKPNSDSKPKFWTENWTGWLYSKAPQ